MKDESLCSDTGMLAAVYARYSSHKQGEQSIDGQLDEARKYATAHGYTIIKEYVDRAKSGKTDNREQFQKMLRDTAKRKFGVLILWKVDRFGRNREEIALNKIKCRKNGVRVEYVAENIPETPEGVIIESVLEGFAEYYSLQLSQNVKRGLAESVEKCQVVAPPPLGYAAGKDKKYHINEEKAATVKLIFQMYADGSSIAEIIQTLNATGHTTARGHAFTINSFYKILKNEAYIGVYTYGGKHIEGGMPRIIDDDTFYKVQKMLKVNKRKSRSDDKEIRYLLTGKLFCGHCGSNMYGESGVGKSGGKYTYYACYKKKRDKTCMKKSVRQDMIEQIIFETIYEVLNDTELLEYIIDKTWAYYQQNDAADQEIEHLKKQLKDVEAAMGNVMRAIEFGIINDETKNRMDELTENKKELTAAIADRELSGQFKLTRGSISYYLYQLRKVDMNDNEMRCRLLDTFVNAIYLYDDRIKIAFNYSGDHNTITKELLEASGDETGGTGSNIACSGPPNNETP